MAQPAGEEGECCQEWLEVPLLGMMIMVSLFLDYEQCGNVSHWLVLRRGSVRRNQYKKVYVGIDTKTAAKLYQRAGWGVLREATRTVYLPSRG